MRFIPESVKGAALAAFMTTAAAVPAHAVPVPFTIDFSELDGPFDLTLGSSYADDAVPPGFVVEASSSCLRTRGYTEFGYPGPAIQCFHSDESVTIRRADNSPFQIDTITLSSGATRPLDVFYETAGEEIVNDSMGFPGDYPGTPIEFFLYDPDLNLGQNVTSWTYRNTAFGHPFIHGFSGFYDNGVIVDPPPPADVSEPTTLTLVGAGLVALGAFTRRRSGSGPSAASEATVTDTTKVRPAAPAPVGLA